MELENIKTCILNSIPYPILFVNCDHIITYMNDAAQYHYHKERGYDNLLGKSLFTCHNEKSKQKILEAFEKIKNHGNEVFIGVSIKNQRIYMNPVRDEHGELIGYFERFELNLER